MPALKWKELIDQIVANQAGDNAMNELFAWHVSLTDLNEGAYIEGLGYFTPLKYAAYRSDTPRGYEVLNLFLSDLSILNVNDDKEGYTALDWAFASKKPNPHAIFALLRVGAKPYSKIDQNTKSKNLMADEADIKISQFVHNRQNTHDPILVESINKSIFKLKTRYPNLIPYDQVVAEINLIKTNLLNHEKKLIDEFLKHPYMKQVYPQTPHKLCDMLRLIWTAIKDCNVFDDSTAPIANTTPLEDRKNTILKKMIACHRGEYGTCIEGRFHALVEPLDHVHPDVTLIYGPGAIKALLSEKFINLLNLSLAKAPNIKQLMKSESQDLENFYLKNKINIINDLVNDYPQAMNEKIVVEFENDATEAENDNLKHTTLKEYLEQVKCDEIPWHAPGLEQLKSLEQIHEWIRAITGKQSFNLNEKQIIFSIQIQNGLDPDLTETYLTAYNRILADAKKLYTVNVNGWVELINKAKDFAFLPNFQKLTKFLPDDIKHQIAVEMIQLKTVNESSFDKSLSLAFCALMPETKGVCTEIQIEGFKSTLIKISEFKSLQEFRNSNIFSIEMDVAAIRNKIDKALLKNRFSEAQLDVLVCKLQVRESDEQTLLLQRLQALYKLFITPKDSKEYIVLLNYLIEEIKKGDWFQKDDCFQRFLFEARDASNNNFFHLVAEIDDSTLFENIVPLPENKKLFEETCLDLNNLGYSAIRLLCDNHNCNVSYLLNNCEKEKAVESILQYHDQDAAFYFLNLNRKPDSELPEFLNYRPELKAIWPLSDLACEYFFHDLNKELIVWLLSITKISVNLFRNLACLGYVTVLWQAINRDSKKRLEYLQETKDIEMEDPIIDIAYFGFIKTFTYFVSAFKTTSDICQYLKRCDTKGMTAIYYAARHNHLNIIDNAFRMLGNDTNAKQELCNFANEAGDTPLIIAAFKGYSKVVDLLLCPFKFSHKEAFNNIRMQNKDGQTALHNVINSDDYINLFKTILSSVLGNDLKRMVLYIQDNEGNTVLCTGSTNNAIKSTNLYPIREAFVENHALMDYFKTSNKKGFNALHCAASTGSSDSITALLNAWENNESCLLHYIYSPTNDESKFTALQVAATAKHGANAIVALLNGITDRNEKLNYLEFSVKSQTAISLAIQSNKIGNLYVLLNYYDDDDDQQRFEHLTLNYKFVYTSADKTQTNTHTFKPLVYILFYNLGPQLEVLLRSFKSDEERVRFIENHLQEECGFYIRTEKMVETMVSAFRNPELLFACFDKYACESKFTYVAYSAWCRLQPQNGVPFEPATSSNVMDRRL